MVKWLYLRVCVRVCACVCVWVRVRVRVWVLKTFSFWIFIVCSLIDPSKGFNRFRANYDELISVRITDSRPRDSPPFFRWNAHHQRSPNFTGIFCVKIVISGNAFLTNFQNVSFKNGGPIQENSLRFRLGAIVRMEWESIASRPHSARCFRSPFPSSRCAHSRPLPSFCTYTVSLLFS